MINLIRQQTRRDECSHEAVSNVVGLSNFGLERSICGNCGQIFLKRTEASESGALFKERSTGGLLVNFETPDEEQS